MKGRFGEVSTACLIVPDGSLGCAESSVSACFGKLCSCKAPSMHVGPVLASFGVARPSLANPAPTHVPSPEKINSVITAARGDTANGFVVLHAFSVD